MHIGRAVIDAVPGPASGDELSQAKLGQVLGNDRWGHLETLAAFRAALSDPQQVLVYYQPQFDLRSMQLTGVEALARWQHPTRGLLGSISLVKIGREDRVY